MDFELTEEQKMIKKTARELAEKKIAPIAAEIDKTGEIPEEIIKKIADLGFFGTLIPPPFGGAGGSRLDHLIIVEEIAAASASVAWSLASSSEVAFCILAFGNDEQKKKYLPSLAKGEKLGAFAIAEPSGGTNWMITMQTKATAEGDEYVVKGSKCFISNAGEADTYIVLLRTDPTKGPMGISALIIDKDTPGFSFGQRDDKLGLRGDSTGELSFDNCRVPKGNLLGREGDGMAIFQAEGALSCASQAAVFAGIAIAALDSTVKYVKERKIANQGTLANFENVQSTISDMTIKVEAAKLLAHRSGMSTGKGPDPIVMLVPTFCSEIAIDVTSEAIRLHGGYGCMKEFPVERYFRDARTLCQQKSLDYVKIQVGKMLLDVPLGPSPPKASDPPRTTTERKVSLVTPE